MAQLPATELEERFLAGMSRAACTVNVVTTDGPAGRAGVTVSAMASVSVEGPTLLVCVHHQSPVAAAILENGVFCVNVLRDDQSHIADTFAGRLPPRAGDKFSCAEWTGGRTGAPRVADPLVAFDCRLFRSELVGTHQVLFGTVEDIYLARSGTPLIYAKRAYGTPLRIDVQRMSAGQAAGEGGPFRLGCFHTFGPMLVPQLLEGLFRADPALDVRLRDGDHRELVESLRAGETEMALIYDFDLGEDISAEPLMEFAPHVLLAQDHRLADHGAIPLAALADEPMILLEAPPSSGYFLSLFEQAGLTPHVRVRSSAFEMVRGLVGQGLGYSILATKPASTLSYEGLPLVTRPLSATVPGSRIVLAWLAGAELSDPGRRFRAACRAAFPAGRPNIRITA